jgi:hypothetical protein
LKNAGGSEFAASAGRRFFSQRPKQRARSVAPFFQNSNCQTKAGPGRFKFHVECAPWNIGAASVGKHLATMSQPTDPLQHGRNGHGRNGHGRNGHVRQTVNRLARVRRLTSELAEECCHVMNEGDLDVISGVVTAVWGDFRIIQLRLLVARGVLRGQSK